MSNSLTNTEEQKYVKKSELILYLVAVFFYTIFHGIMMFLSGVPFFFYKLTGKTKEDIHNAVLEQRKKFDTELPEADEA
ncbi:MAG: hypothetical protein K5755_01015 [Clostridiales bacterium]|nr:hypothetical protein [Clostridiales bacterium]